MDKIVIRGLRASGKHGAFDDERDHPQPFGIDLEVETDVSDAAQSDDLDQTIDYRRLVDVAYKIVSNESHNLIERVAGRIAEDILASTSADAVTVTVRKLRPPIPVALDFAGVTIRRTR